MTRPCTAQWVYRGGVNSLQNSSQTENTVSAPDESCISAGDHVSHREHATHWGNTRHPHAPHTNTNTSYSNKNIKMKKDK